MPWRDLRSFLGYLEEKGDLVHISKEVSTKFEIAAYTRRSSDNDGPAFVFENVAGYPGWRVLGALYAQPRRIVEGLESDRRSALHKYIDANANRIEPRIVDSAPCQEVVYLGADATLNRLPICHHAERDGGPFITAGVAVAKDPDTGVRLLGIHRMQLLGPQQIGIYANPDHRIGRAMRKAAQRELPLEIAVAIGVEPSVALGALAKIDHSLDKFGVAGSLHGGPIDLVKCKTVDLEVPATAEVVIEAVIHPSGQHLEGPFGEFPGTYSGTTLSPTVEIKAITHRTDPIYQTVMACMPTSEDHLMCWLPRAVEVYEAAKMGCPEVVDVRMRGNHVYDTVVSVRKKVDKEAVNVIMTVFGSTQVKYCTVVDDDIDIYNDRDILWAMETRVQPHTDVHIYPMMVGGPLDPSSPVKRHSSKMGVDATLPLDADKAKFQKVIIPGTDDVSW